ncbi:MAG: fibro-slime domain-containing protein [Isosphaeraceae bacterium]
MIRSMMRIGLAVTGLIAPFAGTARADFVLNATIRDFTPATNPDFERFSNIDDRGIVQSHLGADGVPVYSGGTHPTITSATTFYQWYHDTPGVNIAIQKSFNLIETSPGVFQYTNSSFFPIDGQGFGNYANTGHNFHFTTEIHSNFIYHSGQYFTFTGDDDVFVFIDGRLAIDLGGSHNPESQTITLDSWGLNAGQIYNLDIFHAERHTTASNFGIRSNLSFTAVPEPSSFLLLGLAMSGLVLTSATRHYRSGRDSD